MELDLPPEDFLTHAKSAPQSVCRSRRIFPCDGRHQRTWFEAVVRCDRKNDRSQSALRIGQESAQAVAHRAEAYRSDAGPSRQCRLQKWLR